MDISVIVPVYNEQENLPELGKRLFAHLASLGKSWEVIFSDDGSRDRSAAIIKKWIDAGESVKLVRLNRNYGQHSAIFAGFAQARGSMVVTIDADLQNPPEEIGALIKKMEEGYEVVSGKRENRQDSILRKIPSWLVARIASKLVGVRLDDYGSMLRVYRKELVQVMLDCGEHSAYIPALANSFASRVAEISVKHDMRKRGKSKYSLLRLLRLNFDLMTSFSLLPIQLVGIIGMVISVLGISFSIFLLVMRFILGADWAVQGVFTLFGILFFFVGLEMLALGLLGEYIGRIYLEVRERPPYRILEILPAAKKTEPRS